MIRVTWHKSPFDPSQRETWVEPWGQGSTLRALRPAALSGVEGVRAWRNGQLAADEDWDRLLGPSDSVDFGLDPGFDFGATAALSVLGFAVPGTEVASLSFLGATLGQAALGSAGAIGLQAAAVVGNLALSVGLSAFLGGLLKGKPPKPGERESPTYGFGGIESNPTWAGAAAPLILGEHRVAGPIINIFTRVAPESDTYLYILMLVAGHEVTAIGDKTEDGGPFTSAAGDLPVGLQINGQPASELHDIEVHVRMGANEQDLIPGFASAIIQSIVDQTLRESSDVASVEIDAGVYGPSDPEILAWDTEVAHIMAADADEFTAILTLVQGLFGVDSDSGDLKNKTVRVQARYRRAPGGTPTGDYVVLPPFGNITAHKNVPFSISFSQIFIDPTTYVPPTPGHYLKLTAASNDHADHVATLIVPEVAPAQVQMTVSCWIKLADGNGYLVDDDDPVTKITFDSKYHFMWHLGSNQGFGFWMENNGETTQAFWTSGGGSGGIGPIGGGEFVTVDELELSLRIGNGSSATTFQLTNKSAIFKLVQRLISPNLNTDGWVMLSATYKADTDEAGKGEIRFFLDGDQLGAPILVTEAQGMVWPASATVVQGASDTSGTESMDAVMDEVLLYDRALSGIELAAKFSGGFPQPAQAGEPNLVAGWHHDVAVGGTTEDFVGTCHLTLANGATITTTTDTSIISSVAAGTPLKDRYIVELQRINAEDDSTIGADEIVWEAIQLTTYDEYEYPGCALLALKVRGTDQISGGQPTVTQVAKGVRVPVWDGLDPLHPTFAYQWSRNPAWALAFVATDIKQGLGAHWALTDLDLPAFLALAEYSDEAVYDGKGRIDVYKFFIHDAAYVVPFDPNFVNGRLIISIDGVNWPDKWPHPFEPSVTAEDATLFFAIDIADETGVPSWLTDLEGVGLAVGKIVYSSILDRYDIWCHLPEGEGGTADYIEVQRYVDDWGSGGGSGGDSQVHTINNVVIGKASARITNFLRGDSGRTTPGGGVLNNNDVGMTLLISSPTAVTAQRYSGGVDENHQYAVEIMEYVGVAGGPNELIKRLSVVMTIPDTVTDYTYSPPLALNDWSRCFVEITGVMNDREAGGGDSSNIGAGIQGDNTVRLRRGNGTGECKVTVTVWECEGSNWIVHVLSKTMTTVGARESGALGSPVASWNNAFIVHSWRSPSGEVGTTDHGLIACPGTDTSHVDFFLASGAGSVGGGGYVAIAYVIENPEITVEHLLSTTGLGGSLSGFASGDTSKDITITSCDMDTTILIASGIEAGISSTIPLLNIQYMLTSSTNVNMRRGGSGTGMNTYALQVVKMLALDGGVSDVEYFPSSGEGITLGGTEARMEFDGIFDRTDFPGYEALRVITKSARGEPVQKGSILSVFFDAPRDVENLIGMGSTVAGTFSASGESPKTRPNIIEGEFSDRDSNYERAPAAYEHSSVIDPTTLNNRRISVESFEGMTRRSQVMRHMLYKLNYFQLASRMLEFRGGPNALPVQPGSRITYSHDVPQWGFSGRIIRDSNVKGTVYLDREVVLESGHTYSIKVRDSATNTVEEREISSADGTYEAADGIDLDEDLSFLPAEDDEYIFGEELLVGKDFSIMRADLEPSSLVRSLKGIEYIEEIYEDDFGDLPDTVSADVPVASPDALPASVEDLRAEDNTSLQPDGTVMLAAVVAWRHPASSRDLRESIVYLALGDAPDSSAIPVATVSGMGTEARIAHHFLRLRESHTIIVQPVSRSGRRPRLATCSRSTLFVRGNTACLPAPSGISAAVSGTLLRLIWEPLPAARMVEFRRGGWLLGVPFASAPGGAGMAVIADWASAVSNALADADALLVARAATGMGHYGEAGTLRGQPVDDLAEATLISLAEEDGPWTGTKTGFTTSVPAAVKGQPLEDLTTYLRFSGSDLEASYEMQINALAGAQDVIVHTHVVASQVHPLTIAEMSWTLGSPEGQRWTMEGPLWATPEDAQSEPCKLRVEFIPSITDTVPSTGWRRFIPGRQHFRRARFRVVVTRPSTEYDVRVKRFTIKVQRMRSDPSDYIESEVF